MDATQYRVRTSTGTFFWEFLGEDKTFPGLYRYRWYDHFHSSRTEQTRVTPSTLSPESVSIWLLKCGAHGRPPRGDKYAKKVTETLISVTPVTLEYFRCPVCGGSSMHKWDLSLQRGEHPTANIDFCCGLRVYNWKGGPLESGIVAKSMCSHYVVQHTTSWSVELAPWARHRIMRCLKPFPQDLEDDPDGCQSGEDDLHTTIPLILTADGLTYRCSIHYRDSSIITTRKCPELPSDFEDGDLGEELVRAAMRIVRKAVKEIRARGIPTIMVCRD